MSRPIASAPRRRRRAPAAGPRPLQHGEPLRDGVAAGTGRDDLPGDTVGEVLDGAIDRYGSGFAAVLDISRIWVNGDEADRSTAVADGDEVAVLPPVSGGCG